MNSNTATTRMVALVLVLTGAVACGSTDDSKAGKVEVDVRVSVCRSGQCHDFAAIEADVAVLDQSDAVVKTGIADDAGHYSVEVPPGTYRVRVGLDDLGMSSTTDAMQLPAGGEASWSVVLPPALRVTAEK